MALLNFMLVKKSETFLKYWKGGGGEVAATWRARVIVRNFFIFFFSDKINQIGVRHLKNFHFSLAMFKNGIKTEYKPYFG